MLHPCLLRRLKRGASCTVNDNCMAAAAATRALCIRTATLAMNCTLAGRAIWTSVGVLQHGEDDESKGLAMRLATALLAMVLLWGSLAAAGAVTRIADDRGGRIGTYLDRFEELSQSGEPVIIDGLCASACTLVLGTVSHDRICVTPRAKLGCHAAWDMGTHGRPVTNTEATRLLLAMYPAPIRRWIARHGGLKRQMIFLSGRELGRLYRPCNLDTQARLTPRRSAAAGE
jgi:hypothetical protein